MCVIKYKSCIKQLLKFGHRGYCLRLFVNSDMIWISGISVDSKFIFEYNAERTVRAAA